MRADATRPPEYLVRSAAGLDFGRDPDRVACERTARRLGTGSVVIALDDFLLPKLDEDRKPVVVYTAP